jgi:hypothetical protein
VEPGEYAYTGIVVESNCVDVGLEVAWHQTLSDGELPWWPAVDGCRVLDGAELAMCAAVDYRVQCDSGVLATYQRWEFAATEPGALEGEVLVLVGYSGGIPLCYARYAFTAVAEDP